MPNACIDYIYFAGEFPTTIESSVDATEVRYGDLHVGGLMPISIRIVFEIPAKRIVRKRFDYVKAFSVRNCKVL